MIYNVKKEYKILFNFFKIFTSNIKCDTQLTNKNNWYFYGNKIQKLKDNKNIIVQNNQGCFFRCKDKTCDMLEEGKYKVCEEVLPLLYKRLNIKAKGKKVKLKTDIYFYNKNITYNFTFKKQFKLNKLNVKEQISAKLSYKIDNLQLHTKFLFLENAVITAPEYNNIMINLIYICLNDIVLNFKGELEEINDIESVNAIKYKLATILTDYGILITDVSFYNYKDLTKYKNKKAIKNINPKIKETEQVDIQEVKIIDFRDNNQNLNKTNINENKIENRNTFQYLKENKSMVIEPEE